MPDCKLLIIDDDQDIRESLGELMRQEGFEVFLSRSGFAALTDLTYGRVQPHVILVDLWMPSMSGDQFLAVMRRHPHWSRIPVIICSAGDVPEEISAGAFGVVQKPFDFDQLIGLVHEACSSAS
ncbi:MAG TPA: response regulator [Myxococcales bacterium]|nr:response regulator [Myxococcales bacterium]